MSRAVRVLPAAFASDPDRLARFHREAQVLASLNHPHIGAIYGFEDSGRTHALVLEFVDGPTLADRIAQGPIAVDDRSSGSSATETRRACKRRRAVSSVRGFHPTASESH